MKVTFLGTGASLGIPFIGCTHPVCLSDNTKDKRLRVSVLIETNDLNVVIDCGPDFRQQMLQTKTKQLDGILFTHEHADHTAGLDDIRPFVFRQGYVNIYAHKRVIGELKQRFGYIFNTEKKYPGAPSIQINSVENTPFKLNEIEITPINGLHYKLQVFGYRIKDFAYLTDFKTIEEEELNKLKNLEVLVINALREKEHVSHFSLAEALAIITKLKPKKAYLTHISHFMGFHDEVQKQLPENVFLAYDNLKITL